MNVAVGPFFVAALLLAVAGLAKAIHPADTARALRGVGVPAPSLLVRVGGALETVIGVAAIVRGDRATAVLVAVSYLAFAGFVAVALLRRLPIATCGCFGREESPPTWLHIGIDVAAAAAAVAVAIDPGVGIADVVAEQPLAGVPFLLLVLTGAAAAGLALTLMPRLLVVVRETQAR